MTNEVVGGILSFIFGGKAEFSIIQDATGSTGSVDVRYRVVVSDNRKDLFFVYTECNGSRQMKYHGYIIYSDKGIKFAKGNAKITDSEFNAKAIKGLIWVLSAVHSKCKLPNVVHVVHHGRCARCGRKLKDAESLMCGLGPECRKKVGFR